jgi:hypothetical protein
MKGNLAERSSALSDEVRGQSWLSGDERRYCLGPVYNGLRSYVATGAIGGAVAAHSPSCFRFVMPALRNVGPSDGALQRHARPQKTTGLPGRPTVSAPALRDSLVPSASGKSLQAPLCPRHSSPIRSLAMTWIPAESSS